MWTRALPPFWAFRVITENLGSCCVTMSCASLAFYLSQVKKPVCSASSVDCQRDTARICCWSSHLLHGAVAAECWHLLHGAPAAGMWHRHPRLSIDISFRQGAQQQTAACHCCCRSMGQTGGWMLDHFIDPALRGAVPVNGSWKWLVFVYFVIYMHSVARLWFWMIRSFSSNGTSGGVSH